jgi:hypothetical protein
MTCNFFSGRFRSWPRPAFKRRCSRSTTVRNHFCRTTFFLSPSLPKISHPIEGTVTIFVARLAQPKKCCRASQHYVHRIPEAAFTRTGKKRIRFFASVQFNRHFHYLFEIFTIYSTFSLFIRHFHYLFDIFTIYSTFSLFIRHFHYFFDILGIQRMFLFYIVRH